MKYPLFLSLLALLASCAPTLSGQLMDDQGEPISAENGRVNVLQLTNVKEQPVSHVLRVDRTGSFESDRKLPAGSYLVEALIPGYKIESVRIDVDGSKELSFRLKKLSTLSPELVGSGQDVDPDKGAGGASLTPPKL